MKKLHSHAASEEPLMMEVVQCFNNTLFEAQGRGLSLSGGLNCLMHAMAMTLVSAYADQAIRHQVASSIPDVVQAYIPQWEQLIAAAARGERGHA